MGIWWVHIIPRVSLPLLVHSVEMCHAWFISFGTILCYFRCRIGACNFNNILCTKFFILSHLHIFFLVDVLTHPTFWWRLINAVGMMFHLTCYSNSASYSTFYVVYLICCLVLLVALSWSRTLHFVLYVSPFGPNNLFSKQLLGGTASNK